MIETQVRELQALLERKIDEQGYTRLDVEEGLGWEAGTLAQVLADWEAVRLEQVLSVLRWIGVEPDAFFAEHCGRTASGLAAGLAELKNFIGSVVNLLVEDGVINADDLAMAVAAHALRPPAGGSRHRPQAPSDPDSEAEAGRR